MKFRTYKVVVEVTCAAEDDVAFPTASTVHQAMCELLHEGSDDMLTVEGLAVTDVGDVTEHETDPELAANYVKG